jgi:hypothetical protein
MPLSGIGQHPQVGATLRGTGRWNKTMSGIRRWLLLFPLTLALAAAIGCAGNETRQYARELNPAVGKADKAYFIEKYGEPEKRITVDPATDIWEYRFGEDRLSDHATRSNLVMSTLLRLTFRNGTFTSWQASNTLK